MASATVIKNSRRSPPQGTNGQFKPALWRDLVCRAAHLRLTLRQLPGQRDKTVVFEPTATLRLDGELTRAAQR
jgi:hypothetical protein